MKWNKKELLFLEDVDKMKTKNSNFHINNPIGVDSIEVHDDDIAHFQTTNGSSQGIISRNLALRQTFNLHKESTNKANQSRYI